jgi:hypothetical protein
MKSSARAGHRSKSNFPRVRFRLYLSRKYGVGPDKCYLHSLQGEGQGLIKLVIKVGARLVSEGMAA